MPKGHPALSEVQKKEIVARVSENGERVPDLAREFNIHSKTIYNLLDPVDIQPTLINLLLKKGVSWQSNTN